MSFAPRRLMRHHKFTPRIATGNGVRALRYCRDDKTARHSNALKKVFQKDGPAIRRATTGEVQSELRDRWPLATTVILGESPGCVRDGHIRAWRATA